MINYVVFHIANFAATTHQLGNSLNSELDGNPPLWITRRKVPGQEEEDIYVNTAKILIQQSNYIAPNHNHKKQVCTILKCMNRIFFESEWNPHFYL